MQRMPRSLVYFGAFAGIGTTFAATVLTHAEGPAGMFGMVTAMIVEE